MRTKAALNVLEMAVVETTAAPPMQIVLLARSVKTEPAWPMVVAEMTGVQSMRTVPQGKCVRTVPASLMAAVEMESVLMLLMPPWERSFSSLMMPMPVPAFPMHSGNTWKKSAHSMDVQPITSSTTLPAAVGVTGLR